MLVGDESGRAEVSFTVSSSGYHHSGVFGTLGGEFFCSKYLSCLSTNWFFVCRLDKFPTRALRVDDDPKRDFTADGGEGIDPPKSTYRTNIDRHV